MAGLFKLKGLVRNTSALKRTSLLIGQGLIKVYETWLTIQDVFSTDPVLVGSDWVLPDLIDSNNLSVENVQIASPSGNEYGVTAMKITGGSPIVFKTKFRYNSVDRILMSCYANTNGEKGISIGTWNSGTTLIVYTGNGSASAFSISTAGTFGGAGEYEIEFTWDGVSSTVYTLLVNGVSKTFATLNLKTWTGQSTGFVTIFALTNLSSKWTKLTSYIELQNITANARYSFQEGYDKYIFDSTGNGNHFELTGIQNGFWDNTTKGKPFLIINGCSRFQQILDQTKYINVIYDDNGLPTSSLISGYSPPIEIPKYCRI